MSLWRDELKPSGLTLGCLAVLGAIAVGSIGRVVATPDSIVYATIAIAIGALFALYVGRRSLGLGFALLVVVGAVTLPALFVEDGSRLPTPDGFRHVVDLLSSGLGSIPTAATPVEAEPRFLILIWTSLLLLGFLSAAWVVVRRPMGAVISLLAVVTFTGSIGTGEGRDVIAIGAVAATGAFFLAEGRHRIGRWTGGRVRVPGWLGVPTLVIACAIALAAPRVIGDTPILELRSAINPQVVIIKPLSDVRRQLDVEPPLEVMRVNAERPTYWRLTSLDAYDGTEWVLEARPEPLDGSSVPEAEPPTQGEVLEQSYRLTSLLSPWLPAAYAATSIDTGAEVEVDVASQTLLLAEDSSPGLAYTVRSRLPQAPANALADRDQVTDPTEQLFGSLAAPIVGDAETPFVAAQRLEQHFRGYTYSEDVAGGHTVERLQSFLDQRTGYCEQFAAVMTLMMRGLGYDARVGVGFLPGAFNAGEYVVTTRDAHAWVEVNIPGSGWTSFDPTPGRSDGSAAPPPTTAQPTTEPEPVPPEITTAPQPTPAIVPDDAPLPEPAGAPFPRAVLWALLAVVVVGATPAAKVVRRVQRKRGPPDVAVAGAWAELLDRGRDLGWSPRGPETVHEFAARALPGVAAAASLANLVSQTLYGPGGAEHDHARHAWEASAAAAAALSRRSPVWRRALAPFDPRTFIPARPIARMRASMRARLAAARA